MPRLTEVQRGQAIALLMQGQRQQQVALQFGVTVSTIECLVRRLRDTRRVVDRPRVTTPHQDRAIHLAHLRYRPITATETALTTVGNHNRHIHPKTVRNRLREFGLRTRRPYIGFPLTRARRVRRMAWLAAHGPRQFPMSNGDGVFFTDESRFTLSRPDGRHRGERFADACVLERDRFGGGSVMVWGGISHGLKSPLIVVAGNLTGVRYRDEILRPVAVPFVQEHHLIFQQDNARPHVARVCQDFLANHNSNPLDWPPYCQDLSPFEHLWDEMDRRVRGCRNAPLLSTN
jgi:transposase